MFIEMLNQNLNHQRFSVFYICGNYSGILSRLSRRFTKMEIGRAFTVFQLTTIQEKAHHSLILVEHDPMLYENTVEMTEHRGLIGLYPSKPGRYTAPLAGHRSFSGEHI